MPWCQSYIVKRQSDQIDNKKVDATGAGDTDSCEMYGIRVFLTGEQTTGDHGRRATGGIGNGLYSVTASGQESHALGSRLMWAEKDIQASYESPSYVIPLF